MSDFILETCEECEHWPCECEEPDDPLKNLTIEDIWPMQFCSNPELAEHAKLRIAQKVLKGKL